MASETKASNKKLIAITFDDGPSNITARLLDGLKARGAKATFFMLGSCAENYPNTVRRAYEEGHQICSHSYDHPALTTKTDEQISWQMSKTDSILDGILGMDFNYIVRPPYGDVNSRVLSVLSGFSAPSIIWSVDPYDWRDRNAQTVCNRVVSQSFDGAIVLLHDIYGSTVNGVLMAMDILADYGYEFVTLNELYRRRNIALQPGVNHYYCKPNGTQYGPVTAPVLTQTDNYGSKLVHMSAQEGTRIYYTTDGSNPAYSTQYYTEPFAVAPGTTVRAVAAYNLNGSRSAESALTAEQIKLHSPKFSIIDGMIHITNPNPDTDLRYTLDGTPANAESQLYSEPIALFDGVIRYRVIGYGVTGAENRMYVTSNGNLFSDVPSNVWYAETVDRAVTLGLFAGMGNYKFSPETGLTRAMFVTVLYRLMQQSGADVSYECAAGFTDLREDWYLDALAWGCENEIVFGYGDNTFRPDLAITREEMCALLSRCLRWYGLEVPEGEISFPDAEEISDWAREDVCVIAAMKLVKGYSDGSFVPQNTATRAEAASLLVRTYDLLNAEPKEDIDN